MKLSHAAVSGIVLLVLPAMAHAESTDKLIAHAAPFVDAALSKPMADLRQEAEAGGAQEALVLGLAMLAGRHDALMDTTDADDAPLQALNTRVVPLIDAYMRSHPKATIGDVDWPRTLKPTPDESAFAVAYEQARSGDYWLLRSAFATTQKEVFTANHPEIGQYGRVTPSFQQGFYHGVEVTRTIDLNLILTAAHCVAAARNAAGLSYQAWSTLPLSVRLLQPYPFLDIELRLQADGAPGAAKTPYPTGIAACGGADQAQADAAKLKAAGG